MLNFDNFSPKSFERLVQAVSIDVLGPGVTIFGSGPDGGREATFEGEVPFPTITDRWKGYIVIQAKCREKLRHNHEDANWLIDQINSEITKFRDPRRNLRRPEYYLIATNVRLSSVSGAGGKDKLDAYLKSAAHELNLKGYHVWSADELEATLNSKPNLRKSFAAWVTPSDVLASLIEGLNRPNLSRLIPLALARDLRNERDARLRDAGQETEKSIYLDSVFVDLPVKNADQILSAASPSDNSLTTQTEEDETNEAAESGLEEDDKNSAPGIVNLLLSRAADKLDPESCTSQRRKGPRPNRVVILGGPGQGKSTIGQFIAQIARVRLLLHANTATSPQTQEIFEPVQNRARVEAISMEGPARFPIRIDLPTFADALDKAEKAKSSHTLLAHIAGRLSRDMDCAIGTEDVRAWLTTCPWLLLLDGLDEVPASGNRSLVISAIEEFLDEIHLVNADVLVVVSSRPQGYQEALARRHWEHWEMDTLSVEQATRVADRLGEVRVSDTERRAVIAAELGRAFRDPATNSLCTTPLQVTILFGIALLKGTIPQAKWELFERYYTLLRDREAQKQSPDARLFRDFKRQIDALHYEAGFLLQLAAETAGAAAPYLLPEKLDELVTRLLKQDDFDKNTISKTVAQLRRIATERIVLLASKVEGRISFEVRSLQEFMAAAQITSAGPKPITERFRAIAISAHWRHVYRIAAESNFLFCRHVVFACRHCCDLPLTRQWRPG